MGQDWAEIGREELKAQRDPSAVFRMPLCRFAALFLKKSKEQWLAEVNADRIRKGMKPIPAGLV